MCVVGYGEDEYLSKINHAIVRRVCSFVFEYISRTITYIYIFTMYDNSSLGHSQSVSQCVRYVIVVSRSWSQLAQQSIQYTFQLKLYRVCYWPYAMHFKMFGWAHLNCFA